GPVKAAAANHRRQDRRGDGWRLGRGREGRSGGGALALEAVTHEEVRGLGRGVYFDAAAGRPTGRAISSNKWRGLSSGPRIAAWTSRRGCGAWGSSNTSRRYATTVSTPRYFPS